MGHALLLAALLLPPSERLNLLLITADDLNADSMGWMGSKVGATPNVDAFATGAFQFQQAHTTGPICQPSRSALLTGRVPHRNGAVGFNPIRDDVPTLMEVLSAKGYFTAIMEKVDHSAVKRSKKNAWDLVQKGTGRKPAEMGAAVTRAIAAAGKRPFFIDANITDPHRPFYGTEGDNGTKLEVPTGKQVAVPSFLEEIPPVRAEVTQYFGSVRRFDESLGQILKALEASGQVARTLVVFLSDHGMAFPFSKATVYRNGTWTPFLVKWPGMPKPAINRDLVLNIDVMPTVLAILQVPAPDGLDGQSLLPIMLGKEKEQPIRGHIVTHVTNVSSGKEFAQRCVRTKTRSYIWNGWSDGKTKLKLDGMSGMSWKAMMEAATNDARLAPRVEQCLHGKTELYFDLEKDPDERKNLIDDPDYAKEIAQARSRLVEHMTKTQDPLLARVPR